MDEEIIDLGNSMFASADETVINWKGENYYKACGEFVRNLPEGGTSTCVLRVGHPGRIHEDYDGHLFTELGI
jgi:hypothetical protein